MFMTDLEIRAELEKAKAILGNLNTNSLIDLRDLLEELDEYIDCFDQE